MAGSQFDRVAGILRRATYSNDTKEKLECLHQVKELIINYDRSLLDSFFEEVVAFQHYPNNELRRFVIKFIEETCVLDGSLIVKSVACLSHLFSLALHSDPPSSGIIRAIVGTMKMIYCRSLTRAVRCGVIESGAMTGGGIKSGSLADTSLEAFRAAVVFKDEIIRLLLPSSVSVMPGSSITPPPPTVSTRLCANLNDAARIDIIRFVEAVIVQQSRRVPNSEGFSSSTELTLDQIPDLPNSLLKSIVTASTASSSVNPLPGICLVRPRRLSDEAERLFSGLTRLPLMQGDDGALRSVVTSPIFDTLIDSIVSIARQRPQFCNEAVQSFETIHVNLPPHFTQVQVNSARRKLKAALLCLLQHSATNVGYQSRIIILLTDLGATQQEISGVLPINLSPHSAVAPSSSKRCHSDSLSGKQSSLGNEEEDDEEEERKAVRVAKRPRMDSGSSSAAASASTISSTKEAIPSIEEITARLVPKLTTANVADLVLLSMVTLPSHMPAAFDATYTPIAAAGTATQVRHLARLLAAQLVVWATGTAGEEGTNRENRALLGQLMTDNATERGEVCCGSGVGNAGGGGDDEESVSRKAAVRSAKRNNERIDEDDEAAFMKEHAARMHTTTKPMNISVVRGAVSTGEIVASAPTSFNSPIPPSSLLPSTGVTPARPFSLDAILAPLPVQLRQSMARDAFSRILSFECAPHSRAVAEESTRGLFAHFDLVPREAARIKLLCRLPPSRRLSSSYLYPLLITYAMENLKEGFELLANLLMHEYTAFRGFRLAGAFEDALTSSKVEADDVEGGCSAEDDIDDEGEGADEARRLLLESQRQLMALRAREGVEVLGETHDIHIGCDAVEEEEEGECDLNMMTAATTAALGRGGMLQDFGSLTVYDALLTEILTRFVDSGVKSPYFGRLLLEAPLLTANAIRVLKRYCTLPEQSTFGFQVLRSLIELRPSQRREELLDLLLGFCACDDSTVRRAALKATCQLADSHPRWEKLVEDRAIVCLKHILQPQPTAEMFAGLLTKPPLLTSQWTDEMCQLCAHLFFGLMPRNPGKLLLTLAEIYVAASDSVRRCLLRLMDTSICEIGLHSPHLLHLLDNCPSGAETLVTRMIHILTDPRTAFARASTPSPPSPPSSSGPITKASTRPTSPHAHVPVSLNIPIMPPPALVERVRRLYRERIRDVRCLIPVIVGLTKQEVIAVLPQLVQLNEKVVKEVISRLLHASVATQPAPDPCAPEGPSKVISKEPPVVGPVTPEELLVAIHLLEFVKDPNAAAEQPSKKPYVEIRVILQACLHCFAERALYTQERLSAAIGQLLDRPVVPTLFLRTVMQALALYPRLTGYVINVLFRLIQKQVWKSEVLWDGFIRCCVKTQPQSYQVLLQLPPQQLQSVFTREPNLRAQVRRYVDNFSSAQRTHISRGVFEVLEREISPLQSSSAEAVPTAAAATTTVLKSAQEETEEGEKVDSAPSSGSATPLRDEVLQSKTPSPVAAEGAVEGEGSTQEAKQKEVEEKFEGDRVARPVDVSGSTDTEKH
ncbi:Symplekin [Taenia crassiceps]|uniref:Symplekin n=1 Tax=Taenia crassiceps TaxID=6207 RepID=A0ABR4Q213_9CEST